MTRKHLFFAGVYRLIPIVVLLMGNDQVFCQTNYTIEKGTINVRQIVDVKTEQPQSGMIDDIHAMPEHESPKPHSPATTHVHYAKEEKKLQSSQGTGQPSPLPLTGFASKSYNGYYPPDPHGAVNETYVVGTVNDELYIQDRSGNLIADVKLKNFWVPVHQTIRLFDPRLVYDANTKTWMLVTAANAFSDTSALLIALSQSEDPTGTWNLYKIKADPSGNRWADYPNIAFNKSWVAVTVNLFGDTSNSSDTGRVYLLNRSDLMNGLTPRLKTYDVDQGLYPAVTTDSGINDLYLVETFSEPAGQLQMLKISGAIGSEKIQSVGYPAIHMSWSPEAHYGADFAPQLGSSYKIQCNDDRMGSVIFKNNVIWCTHTIFLPADTDPTRASVLWWALDTNAEVLQHGLIDDPSGNTFYAFPSIAVNKYNDALISYAVFSSQQYPGAGYSYHDHAQAAGSINNSYEFITGQNTYNRSGGGRNRWGDCSATVTDPVNDIDFWAIGEYSEDTANVWGCWWTNISGLDTLNHDPNKTAFDVMLAPNPNNGVFNFYFAGQVNTPVQIDIYDLLGKRIYTKTSAAEIGSIGISILSHHLEEGIYIACIKVNGLSIDKKIVVHN